MMRNAEILHGRAYIFTVSIIIIIVIIIRNTGGARRNRRFRQCRRIVYLQMKYHRPRTTERTRRVLILIQTCVYVLHTS